VELLRWFAGSSGLPRIERDLLWGWGTLVFSSLLALGYVAIAFNWYLQRRMQRAAEARHAAVRLVWLVIATVVCGAAFFALDMPWVVWRAYDVALLALAVHTWVFVFRMRGLSLVEERLAEVRELQRSIEKYRELSDHLPVMVWTAAADGAVDFSNLRWAEFVGGGSDGGGDGGGGGTWLDVIHPDDHARAVAAWDAAVARREPLRMELRLGGLAGHRTFLLTATPIIRGECVRWLGACADMEDQKQLAAERERQAKQRAFMLNALGHDLRAPLNAVALNAQFLKMSLRDPDAADAAGAIVDGAHAAGALVSKLLDYARLGATEANELGHVSVSGLLAQLARRFAAAAARKGLSLRVAPVDLAVQTDRMKLERILNNLLDNAVKFTERGTVTVEASCGQGDGDDTAVIRVCDTGAGVPEPSIPYLFNEFYQVNNHERDHTKGFGMGLAICRCLARQLGGDVRLARTGAGGSTFELTLPARDPRRGGRPARAPRAVPNPETAPVCGP
jgi:signal transduction histidine kinase